MAAQRHPRHVAPAAVFLSWVIAFLCATAAADEPLRDELRRIDVKRSELLARIEKIRLDPMLDRMSRSIMLTEVFKDLFMLDYDDPRTRLGAALGMSDTPDDQLLDILFEMVVARDPKVEERKRCIEHLAQHQDDRKAAIHDIVWALCNTREFVELIGK